MRHGWSLAGFDKQIEIVIAVVGLVVVIVYTFYTGLMYCANKKAANAAESAARTAASQLELADRPWLSVVKAETASNMTFDKDGSAWVTLNFTIRNSGTSPAVDVWVMPKIFVPDAKAAWGGELSKDCQSVAGKPSQIGTTIFPGIDAPYVFNLQISRADMFRQLDDLDKKLPTHVYFMVPMVCVVYRSTFNTIGYYSGIQYASWAVVDTGRPIPVGKIPLLRVPGYSEIAK